MSDFPTLSDIKRAHLRIEKYILRTPIMTSQTFDEMSGAEVYFKCENFQKTGSFKIRGASNAIFNLRPEERKTGFATHSSGNHGQAVAFAAQQAGVPAYILMPENAPSVKIDAVRDYQGEVVLCQPNEQDRIKVCDKKIAETGATFVPPFDHYDIVCGQASAAKEFIEEVPELDVIMTPVGGGGLSAGTALAANYISPTCKVYLGEPEEVNDTFRSFKSGKRMPVTTTNTIADGLKVSVGVLNFEIIKEMVEDVFTVTEEEIISAMKIIWERMKIVIEPSCAVPFAVLLKNKEKFQNKKVGIILTGGNVDLKNLPF
jgi:threonine dehydratase